MKKILFVTLILGSCVFGADTKSPQINANDKKDQRIAELEQAFADVAFRDILNMFPPELQPYIKDDVESALKIVNKKNIPEIIEVLNQVLSKLHQGQMGLNIIPDVIKWLIIGVDKEILVDGGESTHGESDLEINNLGDKVKIPHKPAAPVAHLPETSRAPKIIPHPATAATRPAPTRSPAAHSAKATSASNKAGPNALPKRTSTGPAKAPPKRAVRTPGLI